MSLSSNCETSYDTDDTLSEEESIEEAEDTPSNFSLPFTDDGAPNTTPKAQNKATHACYTEIMAMMKKGHFSRNQFLLFMIDKHTGQRQTGKHQLVEGFLLDILLDSDTQRYIIKHKPKRILSILRHVFTCIIADEFENLMQDESQFFGAWDAEKTPGNVGSMHQIVRHRAPLFFSIVESVAQP
ncbi:hypothetical protein P152DRAFT_445287 [Eremomyces bilateralis CBS 781.70]|uniref:Uncharacterized protein n=1 Tax=Eremomyces bilateralis CBS 781.70 TaxID=1392243 RepID=A0A6G1GGH4_9PEZI|nr:uncharacterized protein P152DRAFT_445287 [Eremomyces bilateralis CBS 781.70]KAF1817153.1 hypothetical protein P152DRAFT_445287 [Eremomyces bilateralis CBS 781.70]